MRGQNRTRTDFMYVGRGEKGMEEKILKEIIKNYLPDEIKNDLIFLLMTHDKKDIQILQIPVYEDIMHEGYVLCRYIKEVRYAVGLKHEAVSYVDTLKGYEPHIITLGKD